MGKGREYLLDFLRVFYCELIIVPDSTKTSMNHVWGSLIGITNYEALMDVMVQGMGPPLAPVGFVTSVRSHRGFPDKKGSFAHDLVKGCA